MMTTPSISVASTMAELMTFGRIWRHMMTRREQPATMARRTNSRSFSDSTLAAWITRAVTRPVNAAQK